MFDFDNLNNNVLTMFDNINVKQRDLMYLTCMHGTIILIYLAIEKIIAQGLVQKKKLIWLNTAPSVNITHPVTKAN
jgi:hypothetical protein